MSNSQYLTKQHKDPELRNIVRESTAKTKSLAQVTCKPHYPGHKVRISQRKVVI